MNKRQQRIVRRRQEFTQVNHDWSETASGVLIILFLVATFFLPALIAWGLTVVQR